MSDRPPEDVGALWFRLFTEIGIIDQLATTAFERRLPHGLTQAQFSVLNHLTRMGDGRTPADIAAAMQVTRATMTATLGRLSDKGFIETRPDATDGRSKRVFLTGTGRAVRAEAIQAAAPALAGVAQAFSPADAEAALPFLERLRAWLDANRDG